MSAKADTELASLGRLGMEEGLEVCAESLLRYGGDYDAWAVAYSGGKDSGTLATVIEHLLRSRRVKRPEHLYLVQIDTGVEVPPLVLAADLMRWELRGRGWTVICRRPKPRERLYVQMLGKGLPPANQQYNWWCTRSTKQQPQARLYKTLRARHGRLLVLYGSRVDESDARQARIAKSCTAAGTECGMGLYSSFEDKLAPLVGWRNCAVWDWLAVCKKETGIDVSAIWQTYAADDAEQPTFDFYTQQPEEDRDRRAMEWEADVEASSRMGCVACQIAREDKMTKRLARTKEWRHIAPYQEIPPIIDDLRCHTHRVIRPSTGCAGALQLEARAGALQKILAIQARVRDGAFKANKPHWDLIPPDDEALIRRMLDARTFPQGYPDDPQPMPIYEGERFSYLPNQRSLLEERL